MQGAWKADAVVLRSMRLGEADRVLHLYTRERGRIGAVAKGVRRTRSRFGARLEPLTRVALVLHEGRSELHTVTQAEIIESHQPVRDEPARLAAALVGSEAVYRLFAEGEASERAYEALTRFLAAVRDRPLPTGPPAHDPVVLALQLKLHWVAGFAPRLDACAACGSDDVPLVRFAAASGGAVCAACPGGFAFAPAVLAGMRVLVHTPLAEAPALAPAVSATLARAVADMHAEHGGFRLRSLA